MSSEGAAYKLLKFAHATNKITARSVIRAIILKSLSYISWKRDSNTGDEIHSKLYNSHKEICLPGGHCIWKGWGCPSEILN